MSRLLPALPILVFAGFAVWSRLNGDLSGSQHYEVLAWLAAIFAATRRQPA